MHTLHTTDTFVLGSRPHGESNRVYSLFTHAFGFLYAHGQGVRRLDNRNRYALFTGSLSSVTLVRGRETWRVTGASSGFRAHAWNIAPNAHQACSRERAVHTLLQAYAPREEAMPEIFNLLVAAHEAHMTYSEVHGGSIELLTALRVLRHLGYVALPVRTAVPEHFLMAGDFEHGALEQVAAHVSTLTELVNNALSTASR